MNFNRDNLIIAIIIVIAFLCFLLGSAIPAVPEPLELWSGYEWHQMTQEQKVYYTAGLMTGLWYGARATKIAEEPKGKIEAEYLFARIAAFLDTQSLASTTTALEKYYLAPHNLDAPIVYALVDLQNLSDRSQ